MSLCRTKAVAALGPFRPAAPIILLRNEKGCDLMNRQSDYRESPAPVGETFLPGGDPPGKHPMPSHRRLWPFTSGPQELQCILSHLKALSETGNLYKGESYLALTK